MMSGGHRAIVEGNALPEVVGWMSRLHLPQMQACYDAAIGRNPYLEGRQDLSWVIARDGSVSAASSRAHRNAASDADLEACLARVVLAMRFGQPEGGVVNVGWTLEMSRTRGVHLLGLPSIRQ